MMRDENVPSRPLVARRSGLALLLSFSISFALGCQGPAPESTDAPGTAAPQVAKGSYLLRLSSGESRSGQMSRLRAELARRGIPVRYAYTDAVGLAGTLNIKASEAQVQEILRAMPRMVEAHADLMRYPLDEPKAPQCGQGICTPDEAGNAGRATTCSADCGVPTPHELRDEMDNSWHVKTVAADRAWAYTRGEGIHVAVLDTGYDHGPNSAHPDHPARIGYSYNFAGGNPDFSDVDMHGTHVNGIIAAAQNGYGMVGIAPDVTLHVFQVFTRSGGGVGAANSDLIAATEAAIRNNYHIISMSLGGTGDSELEHQAVRKAYDAGILVVVAAGNAENYDNGDILTAPSHFPGAYPESMGVGATDQAERIADFSSQGSTVVVSAPGVSVYSSVPVGTGEQTTRAFFDIDGVGKKELMSSTPSGSTRTPLMDMEVVDCGHGTMDDVAGKTSPDCVLGDKPKVALIRRGPPGMGALPFKDKLKNARLQGAAAVILYNHRAGADKGALLGNICLGDIGGGNCVGASQPIPVATLAAGDGEYLSYLRNKKDKVKIKVANITAAAGNYADFDGTSMATPVVSGVAALVWSRYRNLTNVQLRQLLAESAVDLGPPGWDNAFGWGRVDAMRALAQGAPRARCGDGKLDRASEICDGTQVGKLSCDDFGWDSVPGNALTCNDRCTSPDPGRSCACFPGRTAFEVSQTITENATQGGVKGTLAIYHVKLNGQPVRGAFANVSVKFKGMFSFKYQNGPSDDSGNISDFTPYDGTMMDPGAYEFAPVITKGSARCHDDQPMNPPTYTVNIKS